jgi:hypothetical protein
MGTSCSVAVEYGLLGRIAAASRLHREPWYLAAYNYGRVHFNRTHSYSNDLY